MRAGWDQLSLHWNLVSCLDAWGLSEKGVLVSGLLFYSPMCSSCNEEDPLLILPELEGWNCPS